MFLPPRFRAHSSAALCSSRRDANTGSLACRTKSLSRSVPFIGITGTHVRSTAMVKRAHARAQPLECPPATLADMAAWSRHDLRCPPADRPPGNPPHRRAPAVHSWPRRRHPAAACRWHGRVRRMRCPECHPSPRLLQAVLASYTLCPAHRPSNLGLPVHLLCSLILVGNGDQ
jgi:hypothetical protein